MRKRVVVLGSTGSIGRQALEVARRHPERVQVTALAAARSLEELCRQASVWRPEALGLERPEDPARARAALAAAAPGAHIEVGEGSAARLAASAPGDVVLNGIVGAAGLAASLSTLGARRRLGLANKETLVVGGPLVRAALERGGELIPVDSEHSAAFQCLSGRPAAEVARLVLTASGGPLRDHPRWRDATPAEVLRHPVWNMGPRITVDSALLLNKGLELIEAHQLFGIDWERLEAVLHREAQIHAWVELVDGSILAQAAAPDMRIPIQLALSWPERWPLDAVSRATLPFNGMTLEPIRPGRFPAFDLAIAAGRAGGTAPCVLNAADEVAVGAFLDGALTLGQVPEVLARVLEGHRVEPVESLEQLQTVDAWARAEARGQVVRV